jgi:hypothetical protein
LKSASPGKKPPPAQNRHRRAKIFESDGAEPAIARHLGYDGKVEVAPCYLKMTGILPGS